MFLIFFIYFLFPIIHPFRFSKELFFMISSKMISIQYNVITEDISGETFSLKDENTTINKFKKKYNLKWYNFGKSVFPSLGTRSSQVYYIPVKIFNRINNH